MHCYHNAGEPFANPRGAWLLIPFSHACRGRRRRWLQGRRKLILLWTTNRSRRPMWNVLGNRPRCRVQVEVTTYIPTRAPAYLHMCHAVADGVRRGIVPALRFCVTTGTAIEQLLRAVGRTACRVWWLSAHIPPPLVWAEGGRDRTVGCLGGLLAANLASWGIALSASGRGRINVTGGKLRQNHWKTFFTTCLLLPVCVAQVWEICRQDPSMGAPWASSVCAAFP